MSNADQALVHFNEMYKHLIKESKTQFCDLYRYLDKLNDRFCVMRQFSLIGYGLEGDHGTFCPRFIGYCMGKAQHI